MKKQYNERVMKIEHYSFTSHITTAGWVLRNTSGTDCRQTNGTQFNFSSSIKRKITLLLEKPIDLGLCGTTYL